MTLTADAPLALRQIAQVLDEAGAQYTRDYSASLRAAR
jgi:hypothetical protein